MEGPDSCLVFEVVADNLGFVDHLEVDKKDSVVQWEADKRGFGGHLEVDKRDSVGHLEADKMGFVGQTAALPGRPE